MHLQRMWRTAVLVGCGFLAASAGVGQAAVSADEAAAPPDQAAAPAVRAFSGMKPPPGHLVTSWVGNSFGGAGGPNGFGEWVQDGAAAMQVSPDGTVLVGVGWDEAGRCVGLYKDGVPNRVLLQTRGDGLPDSAWGWGTGTNALAVSGENIFIGNTGKKLLRFHWTPGQLNSAHFVRAVAMPAKVVAMAARGDMLVVVYPNTVEIRDAGADQLDVRRRFSVPDALDAAIAPDRSLWILAGRSIRRYSPDGALSGAEIPGLQQPVSISIDRHGRIVVADSGPRQQVLFFNVSGPPRLVATFGVRGGILAGVPGEMAPTKLFGLRGAALDAQDNLYVALAFNDGPSGNLFLRSFTPGGKLRWQIYNAAFVDTFGFDPASDGAAVYSRTTRFDLDLTRTRPGSEATPRAITVDPVGFPEDDRLKNGCSVLVRWLHGRRTLFCIGQYAGGYRVYAFGSRGDIAHPVFRIGPTKAEGEQWAWDVDANGGIWLGDAPGKTIRRYAFRGWTRDGKPDYDLANPQSWPRPEGWELIRRVLYRPATDTLYLSGYLNSDRIESWGVSGATIRRYDGWLHGKQTVRWTRPLPRDGNTDPKEGPLTPSSIDVAGDYLFAGMVKPTEGKEWVHVFRISDGGYIGSLSPGPSTVDHPPGVGWLDMPYALQAFRRKSGEYLVLVEEDWRGKNLLYRWKPG